MKQMLCMLSFAVGILSSCSSNLTHSEFFTPVNENTLRAPAYPLVTIDPYTSGWSMSDQLNADQVRHWTGKAFPLLGVIRIDGKYYRFMGEEKTPLQSLLPTAALENGKHLILIPNPKGIGRKSNLTIVRGNRGKPLSVRLKCNICPLLGRHRIFGYAVLLK